MYRLTIVASVALAALSTSLWASKVGSWRQSSNSELSKGEFSHTVLSDRGTVLLSRELNPWSDLSSEFIWDLAQDEDGNLYAATGEDGKIFKVTAEGKSSPLVDTDEQHIFSLASAADGTLYAGTAPNGLVLKINSEGEYTTHFETDKHYVWDLVLDSEGNLYAATGTGAEVFRINPDGTGKSLYRCKQKHMLSLALRKDGMLYAGCDGEGLVYRIDPQGKAFVLYDASQEEIRTLLAAADGSLYVGTSSPTVIPSSALPGSRSTRPPSSSSGRSSTGALSTESGDEEKEPTQLKSTGTSRVPSGSSTSRTTTKRVTPGNNAVYRIGPDGAVRELFRDRLLMLSLVQQKQSLLVGTGQSGQLFELDDQERTRCELARLDQGEILAMTRRPDGSIVLATGNPGKLYVVKPGYAAKGTYVSRVFDAKMISHWGKVEWRGDLPHATKITLAVRSGNLEKPDDTWSEWSAEMPDPRTAQAACPPARFLQFRATFQSARPELTPALHSVLVRYMTANQAPEVTKLEVPDIGAGDGRTRTTKLKIKWDAKDPNQDGLEYTLSFRKDDWKNWINLAEKLTKKEFSWNTDSVPEGHYRVRVQASDHTDNPPEKTLTGVRNSELFVVDHAPPKVELKTAGSGDGEVSFEAQASDGLTRITRASYSIDSGDWTRIFPVDGLFDSPRESFRFAAKDLDPGTHLIVIRAVDAAGNTSTADLVFSAEKPSK